MSYDTAFYDLINPGARRSAETIVPVIIDLVEPQSVVDFGCGEGVWLDVFQDHVADIHGVDGPVDLSRLQIPAERFTQANLATDGTLDLGRKFDLAISLEVAEHLPPERADWFVDVLTAHSDVILFSAAIPGQGGVGHLNEAWPECWAELFWERNFEVSGALRWEFWTEVPENVEVWYAQNLLLCVARLELDRRPRLTRLFEQEAGPLSVVHPFLWDSRR